MGSMLVAGEGVVDRADDMKFMLDDVIRGSKMSWE